MLSMYVSENHRDWDEYIPYVTFAYNTVVQDSTGLSPFYILYGYQSRMIYDVNDVNEELAPSERLERLHEARELAISATRRSQAQQKTQYDKRRHLQEFQVGQKVLIHRIRGYIGQSTKLRHPYEGP